MISRWIDIASANVCIHFMSNKWRTKRGTEQKKRETHTHVHCDRKTAVQCDDTKHGQPLHSPIMLRMVNKQTNELHPYLR